MKAGFISLGCSKNLVDTEVMLGILQQHGIELTANPAEADILIVNTCAFIQSAKEESITTILNMAEYKESGRCRSLIVAGCLGQRYKQELLDEIPEADAIIDEALRRLGDRISVLHLKDYTVDPEAFMTRACACGTGLMRYERLLDFGRRHALPMTLENTKTDNAEAARLFLENLEGGLNP